MEDLLIGWHGRFLLTLRVAAVAGGCEVAFFRPVSRACLATSPLQGVAAGDRLESGWVGRRPGGEFYVRNPSRSPPERDAKREKLARVFRSGTRASR
jgi:hypothetical protein